MGKSRSKRPGPRRTRTEGSVNGRSHVNLCSSRKAYGSESTATKAAAKIPHEHRVPYQCGCGSWHLAPPTKKPPGVTRQPLPPAPLHSFDPRPTTEEL